MTAPRRHRILALFLLAAALLAGLLPADPAGAYLAPSNGYVALPPQLILDTQTGLGAPIHPMAAHTTVTVPVPVPVSGATGFEITFAALHPTATGYLTAWPAGTPRPSALAVKFNPGETITGDAFVKGNGSVISVYNGSAGTVDVTAVLTGYTTYSTWARGAAVPVTPNRILDTRSGLGAPAAAIAAGATLTLQVTGRGGIPTSLAGCPCVNAAALTVTALTPSVGGYLLVGNGSTVSAAAVQLTGGRDRSNLVWAALSSTGKVAIRNVSGAPVQVVADADGYNVDAGAANAGGQLFAGINLRRLDTRTGVGGPAAPLAAHGTRIMSGLDPNWAYLLNVTLIGPSSSGTLEVYTGGTTPVGAAVVMTPGHSTTNLVLVRPSPAGQIALTSTSAGPVQVVVDEEGAATGCC
jgi:hypothetical protein